MVESALRNFSASRLVAIIEQLATRRARRAQAAGAAGKRTRFLKRNSVAHDALKTS